MEASKWGWIKEEWSDIHYCQMVQSNCVMNFCQSVAAFTLHYFIAKTLEKKVSYHFFVCLFSPSVSLRKNTFHRASEKSNKLCTDFVSEHIVCKYLYCPYADAHLCTTDYIYRCVRKMYVQTHMTSSTDHLFMYQTALFLQKIK